MKISTILWGCSIFLLLSCKATDQASPSWLNGTWEGIGYQLDLEEDPTWTIVLEINVSQPYYAIKYPSLGCTGRWKLIQLSKNRAVFEELILKNTASCTEKGMVIVTRVDDHHISYSYYPRKETEVAAFSTLKRKR